MAKSEIKWIKWEDEKPKEHEHVLVCYISHAYCNGEPNPNTDKEKWLAYLNSHKDKFKIAYGVGTCIAGELSVLDSAYFAPLYWARIPNCKEASIPNDLAEYWLNNT